MRVMLLRIFLFLAFLILYPNNLFAADTIPPTGKIVVNGNKSYTNTITVAITLTARDTGSGLSQMMFSNDDTDWSTPEKYSTRKTWQLTPSDGPKTVYVKFSDRAGNWSAVYSDSITLDTQGPLLAITLPTEGEVIR